MQTKTLKFSIKTVRRAVRQQQMKYTDDHFRLSMHSKNSRQNFFTNVRLDN